MLQMPLSPYLSELDKNPLPALPPGAGGQGPKTEPARDTLGHENKESIYEVWIILPYQGPHL